MLAALFALHAPATAATTLEISVSDPRVVALVLECQDGTHKLVVENGKATLEQRPVNCAVHQILKSGAISEPGEWSCTLDGCVQQDVAHRDVSDVDGRINVIVTSELTKGSWFELTCAAGYRERVDITENTATFDNVPDSDCTLFFKGGVPAKYNPIRWGTWQCRLSESTAVCSQR